MIVEPPTRCALHSALAILPLRGLFFRGTQVVEEAKQTLREKVKIAKKSAGKEAVTESEKAAEKKARVFPRPERAPKRHNRAATRG